MNCKEGAIQLIEQIIIIIEVIPECDYAKPLEVLNQSTLGKHFRHIYDFFNCLVEQSTLDEVDYAKRNRDPLIEAEKSYVIDKFSTLKNEVAQLKEKDTLTVYADFELSDGQRPKVSTSIGRELMYAYDHAVHHLAIVKIGLKDINPSLPIGREIGVAASTIQHQYELTHGH